MLNAGMTNVFKRAVIPMHPFILFCISVKDFIHLSILNPAADWSKHARVTRFASLQPKYHIVLLQKCTLQS